MRLAAIAAVGPGRVVGAGGRLPWRKPRDLGRFRALTMDAPVIVGRSTWESLPGRRLVGRTVIVVTRRPALELDIPAGVLVVPSPLRAVLLAASLTERRAWVAGGPKLWESLLPLCDELHMTVVHEPAVGDAFFPEIGPGWQLVHAVPDTVDTTLTFLTYVRA
jgi:dihydrofolate reductase